LCRLCGDVSHVDVDITIRDLQKAPVEKIEQAMEVLCKAAGIKYEGRDRKQETEQSPYLAVRELEAEIIDDVENNLTEMFDILSEEWFGGFQKAIKKYPFKVYAKGKIDPRTGKPFNAKSWDDLVKTLESGFGWVFGKARDRIAAVAAALGFILQGMVDKTAARQMHLKEFDEEALKEAASQQVLADTLAFAQQEAAEHIVDLSARARKKIATRIIQAHKERESPQELEQGLFTEFGYLNRDWRRIAITEFNTNFNNGYLISELRNTAGQEEPVFMVGISSPTACTFCLDSVRDQIVVLRSEPPDDGGDMVVIDGKPYTAIWPGKSNVGRPQEDWWVAAGTQHPHCRCTWERTFIEDEFAEMERKVWESANGPGGYGT
jgi:hypothetical protein